MSEIPKAPDGANLLPIVGAFGGSKTETQQRVETVQQEPAQTAPPPPKEAPDTLFSTSFARVLDLICEGPIAGLCDRNGTVLDIPELGRGMFIEETPLQQENRQYNFRGLRVGMTFGTQSQHALTGYGTASEVIYSGVKITTALPVVVGITNPEAHSLIVAVRVPSLLHQDNKSGDINGSAFSFSVFVSLNGGAFALQAGSPVVTRGKATSPFLKYVGITLPQGDSEGSNAWQVKVVRNNPDAPNLSTQNDTYLDFITVRTRNTYRYPWSVLVGTEINAAGFSSIPNRSYRVKGLLIRVPTNYFPETRLYNRGPDGEPVTDGGEPVEQIWDGTFYTAWSDNPAWCFYDLATNKRYGLGDYLDENSTDKWTLYSIGKYCDGIVDDGLGSMEPRMSCNVCLTSREQAWKVITDMASIFRGMIFWQAGGITAVQDCPKTTFKTFTNANVQNGSFSYSGTAKKSRHTTALIRWNDPEDFFRPKFESVEDVAGMARYGYRQIQVAAFGCTSRGQAHRLGKWVLITDLYETDTISFSTGQDGAILRPGDIIAVLDNDRAGSVQAGRAVALAGDRLSLTLDRGVNINSESGGLKVTLQRPQGVLTAAEVANSAQIDYLRNPQVVELDLDMSNLPTGAGNAAVTQGSNLIVVDWDTDGDGDPTMDVWDLVAAGDFVRIQSRNCRLSGVAVDLGSGRVTLILADNWAGETNAATDFAILAGRLIVTTEIPAEVQPGCVFAVSKAEVQPSQWRVINIVESDKHIYEITALQYIPGKFDSIEGDLELEPVPIADLPENLGEVLPPYNLAGQITTVITPGGVQKVIALTWEKPIDPALEKFLVEWRQGDGNWTTIEETTGTASQLAYQTTGTYDLRVTSVSIFGVKSDSLQISVTVNTTNPVQAMSIAGLELVAAGGLANGELFAAPDAKFQWRLVNPNSTAEPGQEDNGASDGFIDPFFDHFLIQVFDTDTGFEVYRETSKDPTFNFTFTKNAECEDGPRNLFKLSVRAVDAYNSLSPAATIIVSNPAPPVPSAFTGSAAWKQIFLKWTNPTVIDFSWVEVWVAVDDGTPAPEDGVLIGTTTDNVFSYTGADVSTAYRFWLRAVDTFGNKSGFTPAGGLPISTGTVENTDLDDFAVDATKQFTNVIALQGDLWKANDPGAGSISWNEHILVFRGVKYTITAGSTLQQYVWWKGPELDADTGVVVTPGETVYRTANTHPRELSPPMTNGDFIIATNANGNGVPDFAWRALANAVIGSAYIQHAAILDAHIATLNADKIVGGTIESGSLKVGVGSGKIVSIAVTGAGTGYATAPDVTFTGGAGAGAAAVAVVDATGHVIAVTVIQQGAGYTTAPTVHFTGSGSGATATATTNFGVVGTLQSDNYDPGVAGWAIDGQGNAEFRNVLVRGAINIDTTWYNSDFMGKTLLPRPTLAQAFPDAVDCLVADAGATNQHFLRFNPGTGLFVTFTTKALVFCENPAGIQERPSKFSNVFFGVGLDDFIDPDASTGAQHVLYDIQALPRRLAYDGWNIFTVEGFFKADTVITVWFQIHDTVSSGFTSGQTNGQAMGNQNSAAGLGAPPWYWAFEITNSGGGYEVIAFSELLRVYVPSDKYILWGVIAMDKSAARPDGNDLLSNGMWKICAENMSRFDGSDPFITTCHGPFDPP